MQRLLLTSEDLARIHVRPSYGPLVESSIAFAALQGDGHSRVLFDGWRRRHRGPFDGSLRLLTELFPRVTYFDLIGIVGSASSMAEGLETFQQTPSWIIEAELRFGVEQINSAFRPTPGFRAPRWAEAMLDRDGKMREQVAGALDSFHNQAIAPYWGRMRAKLDAEHARLVWTLAEKGVDALLNSLHPSIRWRAPFLEIDRVNEGTQTWSPEGRGLALVPSFFCPPGYPTGFEQKDLSAPWFLMYPALREPSDAMAIWHPGPTDQRALAALLGQTRADVLQAIAERPCTTTELATRARTSLASASQHAAILRNAGLIATRRQGSSVRHELTVRGANLLC